MSEAIAHSDIAADIEAMGARARTATATLANATTEAKNAALTAAAAALRAGQADILAANEKDLAAAADKGLSPAMTDRLKLDETRVEAIAKGLEDIAALPDPVGQVAAEWDRPNGLKIQRVRTPLGVIGIIYESRPNVTADAGGLCLKSGNAVILRGGSESFHSSRAIHSCLEEGLEKAGLPKDAVQLVGTTDRAAVGEMLRGAGGAIDVIIPRGGKSLVGRVQDEARVPVLGHLEGLCHVYVDKAAKVDMAVAIAVNAKMRRTGICGAAETLLIDRAVADTHLKPLANGLIEAGCALRGDAAARALDARITPAEDEDWVTEYLAPVISVRIVDGVEAAIQHIQTYGSGHTESIVTEDAAAAEAFLNGIDSAIVMHNASTQFADGGEFGMGAEIGIATGKLHTRGPVGAEQLTSYKYVVRGAGQTRA